MSASPSKVDIGWAKMRHRPQPPGWRKDHKKGTAPTLTAGEHDACGSADVLATDRKRRSTGSDCTSHDCRRARSADILRLSDTRSPTAYHRRPSRSPRTMELRSSLLPLAVGLRLEKQERQPRKSCGSSLTSLVGACNNTEEPVSIASVLPHLPTRQKMKQPRAEQCPPLRQ
jgi:hypothetical protein